MKALLFFIGISLLGYGGYQATLHYFPSLEESLALPDWRSAETKTADSLDYALVERVISDLQLHPERFKIDRYFRNAPLFRNGYHTSTSYNGKYIGIWYDELFLWDDSTVDYTSDQEDRIYAIVDKLYRERHVTDKQNLVKSQL